MIAGIVAQETRVPPRGTIPLSVFIDDDYVPGAILAADYDDLVFARFVADDGVIYSPNIPKVWSALFLDVSDAFFRPALAIEQRMYPLLFTAVDTLFFPDTRVPGYLLPPLHGADNDVIFSTLFFCPGSMTTALHVDLDEFPAPAIAAPRTMFPATVVSAPDNFFVPQVRYGIGPTLFLNDDFIPHLITKSIFQMPLLFDDARPVTPIAVLDGAATGVTVSSNKLTATHNSYSDYCGVSSTLKLSTGKHYFEALIGQTHGWADCVAIMFPTTTYVSLLRQGSGAVVIYAVGLFTGGPAQAGTIHSDGDDTGYCLGQLVAGDLVGVAIDFDNQMAWFRKNGGPWNGVPSHDPARALGGVYVPLGEFIPAVGFGYAATGQSGIPGDNITMNFGTSEFGMQPPQGFDRWQVPSPFPPDETADRFGNTALGIPAILNGFLDNVTLTNGSLTATRGTGFFGTGTALSASLQNFGKFYFEVTIGQTHGANDCMGIAVDGNVRTDILGVFNDGVVYCASPATISVNSNSTKALGRALIAGDVVSVAADLTDQTKTYGGSVWFRVGGGPWNGDATADPALRVGGLNLTGYHYNKNMTPGVAFGGTNSVAGDFMTANFGQSPFVYKQPAGFAIWPQKILNVVQIISPQSTLFDELIPTPSADQSVKVLVSTTVVQEPDTIFPSDSFGGNLFLSANTIVDESDVLFVTGFYGSLSGTESANVTVTNGDLVATLTTALANTGARSDNFRTFGKYYFEITAAATHSSNCAGLLTLAGSYTNMVTNGTNSVSVLVSNGAIFSNNTSASKNVGVISIGNVLGFAIDMSSHRGWIRRQNGPWNNDANANPSTNVGGFVMAAGAFAPAVGFGGGGQLVGDAWNCNFGQATFFGPPPVSFQSGWPGGSELIAVYGVTVSDLLLEAFPPPAVTLFTRTATAQLVPSDDQVLPTKVTSGNAAVLDGASANVTLSNGNKTATHNAAVSNSGATSITTRGSGKFYFEVRVGQSSGANDAAGVLYGTLTDFVATLPANCFEARLSTGAIFGGGLNSGLTVGAAVAGDVLGFAIDFGNGRGWVSRNGGFWNGSSTADPLTNVGGVSLVSGQNYAPAVGFGGTGTAINDAMTLNCGPAFASANASPAGYTDWTTTPPTLIASFDGGSANVATSNNNLTATHINATNNSGVRSIATKNAGKFYFEVTVTTTHGAFDSVGIITPTGTFTDFVTSSLNCFAIYKNTGNLYSNNANSGKTLGAIAAGDVIGVAVDLDLRKGWMRKNGGLWNNGAIGVENPASALGGATLAAAVGFAPAVGFGGTGTAANDAMTGNFADTNFQTPAPSGFIPWSGGALPLATLDGVPGSVTLSNGNLTGTHTTNVTNSGARSATVKLAGKFYFEAHLDIMPTINGGVGILLPAAAYQSMITFGTSTSVVYPANGNIWSNGGNTSKTLGPMAVGDTICVATNFDTLLVWFRKNHSGTFSSWNGDPTADPATGVGGIPIQSALGAWGPAISFGPGAIGDQMTVNFGQSSYLGVVPANFANWTI